jgi:hypothetical protein
MLIYHHPLKYAIGPTSQHVIQPRTSVRTSPLTCHLAGIKKMFGLLFKDKAVWELVKVRSATRICTRKVWTVANCQCVWIDVKLNDQAVSQSFGLTHFLCELISFYICDHKNSWPKRFQHRRWPAAVSLAQFWPRSCVFRFSRWLCRVRPLLSNVGDERYPTI